MLNRFAVGYYYALHQERRAGFCGFSPGGEKRPLQKYNRPLGRPYPF